MDAHERPVVTEENKTAIRAGSTGNNLRHAVIASIALAAIAAFLSSTSSGCERHRRR